MAESARDAALRAVAGLCEDIRREAQRADDRMVAERVRARDEDGRPRLRVVEQADDADERAEQGIF